MIMFFLSILRSSVIGQLCGNVSAAFSHIFLEITKSEQVETTKKVEQI